MSFAKHSNELRQRLQTAMPLPPYLVHAGLFLFSQRCIIAAHE
jgi:hypothetical protein